jgi:4-amino-4-deoxy-L-arabinose transferase-like glycosyltransferase
MDDPLGSGDLAAPRSLAGWLPLLWTRVLFPGAPARESGPVRPRALAALLVLPAILLYPCLSFRLFEPDESRYAQISSEMLRHGEFVVPTLQGEPYLDKPPLLYWLVMATYRLFGVHDWAARLVPALAVHACVLLAYLFGRRWVGERGAWWGALGLALAPGFLSMGRLVILDGLLTLWTTLALFAAFAAVRGGRLIRGWWLLAAAACGLGILTKGPVAVALLAPPVCLHLRLGGRGCRPGWRAVAVFGLVVLAIAMPWYVGLTVRVPGFASYFFWEHNVKRFLTPFAHARGVWFYVPVVWLALLPGTLLVVPLLRFLGSTRPEVARLRSTDLGFLLLGGGWCVLFFSLSAGKLPTYILPALPPIALVLGHFVAQSRWGSSGFPRWAAAAAFVLLAALHHIGVPWYAAYRSPVQRRARVLELCADLRTPVVCYPRNCDSVAFYIGRDDLRAYRTKEIEELRYLVRTRPRTVVLCTHRNSLRGLKRLLPPEVRVVEEVHAGLKDIPGLPAWLMRPLAAAMGETALGLGDVAVVEPWGPPAPDTRARSSQRRPWRPALPEEARHP